MDKRKYICIGVVVVAFLVIAIIKIVKIREENKKEYQEMCIKRYNQMKKDIYEFDQEYINFTKPYCEDWQHYGNSHVQLVNSGFEKEKLLDVDNKSYCKAYVENRCVQSGDYFNDIKGKWETKVYLNCLEHKDKGFKDLGNRDKE